MKIQSCSLNGVRGLPPITLDFADPVSGQARTRTVIAGSNGSGKTTLLEAIVQLLGIIEYKNLNWVTFDHASAQLIIENLPPGNDEMLFIKLNPETPKGFTVWIGAEPASKVSSQPIGVKGGYLVHFFNATGLIHEQAEQGMGDYPNCLYFPSEHRQLQKKQIGQVIAEATPYQWVYRFSDNEQWPGSLESFLVAMYFRDLISLNEDHHHTNGHNGKVHNGGEFKQFTTIINRFLSNKQIIGVDRQTFRIQVQGANGQPYGIDQLSSGEKQILLLLGEIQRRIRRGSIVLIDEPELHLHPRWQRQLVQALTDFCATYDAQLIMTTHSEEIAHAVYEHELILLDDIFQPASSTNFETIPSV
jgi:predicted ATPase